MQAAAHEIAACSFAAWYPGFQHLTFRSEVLPLPPGFADFLVQDGVFVSSGTSAVRESAPMHCMSAASGWAMPREWFLEDFMTSESLHLRNGICAARCGKPYDADVGSLMTVRRPPLSSTNGSKHVPSHHLHPPGLVD